MSSGRKPTENADCARAARLRYVTGEEPGITRIVRGGGFIYRDASGRSVRDRATRDRIAALVIPPAWTGVWICPDADGHLQATGRDARGRKQYRYHPNWTAARDSGKYDRMVEFGLALPGIRKRVDIDIRKAPLSREHVLATVVRLLEETLIRIGNKEYARANKSYGLTTLLDEHVRIKGTLVVFHFRAKSGLMQEIAIDDATLAPIVEKCRKVPGHALFQYLDGDGRRQSVDSVGVNAYLREITGRTFTAKNFRTWAGTVIAAKALSELAPAESESAMKRNVVKAVDAASKRLANTRAVCRRCYVHPAVFDAYRDGVTIASVATRTRRARFSADEAAVLTLLKRRHQQRAA